MGTLAQQMAEDWQQLANTDDFAVSATITVAEGGVTAALALVPEDQSAAFQFVPSGSQVQARTTRFIGQRSAVIAAIATALGAAGREPRRGETVTVASGPFAGAWSILSVVGDLGDGIAIQAQLATRFQTAAPGAIT